MITCQTPLIKNILFHKLTSKLLVVVFKLELLFTGFGSYFNKVCVSQRVTVIGPLNSLVLKVCFEIHISFRIESFSVLTVIRGFSSFIFANIPSFTLTFVDSCNHAFINSPFSVTSSFPILNDANFLDGCNNEKER